MKKITDEDLNDPNTRLLCIRDDDEDMWVGQILHVGTQQREDLYRIGVVKTEYFCDFTLDQINGDEVWGMDDDLDIYIKCIRVDNMTGKAKLALKMKTGWDVKL